MDPDIEDVTMDPLQNPSIDLQLEEPLCIPLKTEVKNEPESEWCSESFDSDDSDYFDSKQQQNLISRKRKSKLRQNKVKKSKSEENFENDALFSNSENEKSDDNLSEYKASSDEFDDKVDNFKADDGSTCKLTSPEDIDVYENDEKFKDGYRCLTCNVTFTRKGHMENHFKTRKHKLMTSKQKENEKFDDDLLEYKASSDEFDEKSDNFKADDESSCDSAGPEDIDLYENDEKFKDVYKCLTCNVTFSRKGHMENHFKTRKHKLMKKKRKAKPFNSPNEDDECYECSDCNLIFQTLKSWKNHQKSKKHTDTKFYCEICNVSTTHKTSHLSTKNHLRLAGISFFCKFCEKTYETKEKFIQHGTESHPDAKICPVCTDIFVKEDALNTHMKTTHEKEKSFKCSDCDNTFALKVQLKRHIRKNHMNDFYCDECSIGFKSEQHLNSHIYNIHTAKEITVDIEIPELLLDIEGHHLFVENQISYVKELIEQKQFEVVIDDPIEYIKKDNSGNKANEEIGYYHDEEKFNFKLPLNQTTKVKQEIINDSENLVINIDPNKIKVENLEDLSDFKNNYTGQGEFSENRSYQAFHGNAIESDIKHEQEIVETYETDYKNEVKNEDADKNESENGDGYEGIESDEREGQKHTKPYLNKKYKCDICNHRCSSKSELDKHMQTSTSTVHKLRLKGELKCEICIPNQIMYFTSVPNWEKHARSIAHRKNSGNDYPCKFCKKMINVKNESDHNKEVHPGALKCDKCAEVFGNKRTLREHKKQIHGNISYKCLSCNYSCKNFRYLKDHVTKKHDMTFVCSECFMAFKQESHFAEHMELMHPLKVFKCEPCAKSFYRERLFNEHFNKFHKKEGFQCNECGKCFTEKFTLKQHIENKHLKIKRCICPECGEGFFEQSYLDYHMRSKHNDGKKSFFCSICGKGFVGQHELRAHNIVAHIKKQWTCKICRLEFGTKTDLNFHTKVDHENAPTFPCNECEKVFLHRQILKVHYMSSHSDMLRFICQICGKSILSQSIAKQHLKNDHNTEDTKYMKKITKYKCRICNMPFENVPDLKQHRGEVHNITNPYWYMLHD